MIGCLEHLVEHFFALNRKKQTSWMVEKSAIDPDVLQDAIDKGIVFVMDLGPPEGEQVLLTDMAFDRIREAAIRWLREREPAPVRRLPWVG